MRNALISAIVASVEQRFHKKARKFLLGLSTDELQYIGEFLGACILESAGGPVLNRCELSESIAQFEQVRRARQDCPPNQEHKMILLLEYLCRTQSTHCSLAARTERG